MPRAAEKSQTKRATQGTARAEQKRSAEVRAERGERLPSGRHGLPRESVAEAQRQRILRAMVAAVAERGYAETRVVDVIEIAGVSRKTFYELYADKEECFLAAYDFASGELFETGARAYEASREAPWAERIRAGLAAMLELLSEQPDLAKFTVIEVLAAGTKAHTRRDAAIREFTHFIDAGRAESSLELPGITSVAVAGGIQELLYTEILHGATARLPARLPELVYWVTQPFLGSARAATERERARALSVS